MHPYKHTLRQAKQVHDACTHTDTERRKCVPSCDVSNLLEATKAEHACSSNQSAVPPIPQQVSAQTTEARPGGCQLREVAIKLIPAPRGFEGLTCKVLGIDRLALIFEGFGIFGFNLQYLCAAGMPFDTPDCT